MKWLISAACVAVITFVGYFFWVEFGAGRAIRDALEPRSKAETDFENKREEILSASPDATDDIFKKPIKDGDFNLNLRLPEPSPTARRDPHQ